MKKITALLLVAVMSLCAFTTVFAEEPQEIKVYVNGSQVEFGDNKPMIKNGRLFAPVRGVFESVGAIISWNPDTKHIIFGIPGRIIELRVGYRTVRITTSEGSRQIQADVSPEIINGATYVPLAVIAESMRGEVEWNQEERAAYITLDVPAAVTLPAVPETPEPPSVQEEPAVIEEPPKAEEQTEAAETAPAEQKSEPLAAELPFEITTDDNSAKLGDSNDDIAAKFGKDSVQSDSVYGYIWREINAGYGAYMLVGLSKGSVVAFYSNSAKISVAGITPGMSAAQLDSVVGKNLPREPKSVINTSEGKVTVYRNSLEDFVVLAVLAQKTGHTTPLQKLSNYYSPGAERQLLEIINTERTNRKLWGLKSDEPVAKIAKSHSQEMAEGNFLSHEDSLGADTFDRLDAKKISGYEMASESIGRDCVDAIEMYYQWMNARMDAANIMAANYNYAGIGVAPCPNNHRMYYTAVYIER